MILKVLNLDNLSDIKSYNSALNSFKSENPYYKTEFIDTFSSGLNNAHAFMLLNVQEQVIVLMPFYIKKIEDYKSDEDYFDIISVYGYSGPLFYEDIDENLLQEFWKKVDEWYSVNNIVSEFIRFNLNNNCYGYSGHLIKTLSNIKGKIIEPIKQWENYDRKVRKNVNKAISNNLKVNIYYQNITPEIVNTFYAIYVDTMNRTHAPKQFFYKKQKIESYINKLKNRVVIAITYKESTAISSELILLSKTKMYSLLGGTMANYFNLRPNDILKHEVINWAFKKGFKYFILGGGHGSNDGIYRYKKSFFPNDISVFYTGRKIINKKIYIELSRDLIKIDDTYNMDEDFFPIYRKTS